MPLTYFICPDKQKVSTNRCLEKCRMRTRCLTKSTLKRLATPRPALPNPSVTELLNGPRLEYLKRKHEYAMSPEDLAFALLGTMAHSALEMAQHLEGVNEQRMYSDITTGQFDNLEYEDDKWHLTDYKTWGNYKVKRFLEEGDHDLELQLNMLKILIEQQKDPLVINGKKVDHIDKLWVEIIVRDGGTYVAKGNGIRFKMRRLPVTILEPNYVKQWFEDKKALLTTAIKADKMPRLCHKEEAWAGRRCDGYCPVKEWCVANGDNTYIKKERR